MRRWAGSVRAAHAAVAGALGRFCIGAIRAYQRTARFRPPTCRFVPSCSEYTAQAIARYGVVKGIALGCWRIVRCNPFCKGGEDPLR